MVLLVDDALEQLKLRQLILEHEGFSVATAGSASEAIAQCCGECDTVVIDLRLPTLQDGLSLIRALHERTPATPLIVLAGFPDELKGRPEHAMVRHVLRKGNPTRVLIDLLRSTGKPPSTP